ncbi:hypothetical protein T4A_14358, partial [Trichinella pseudospiralis]
MHLRFYKEKYKEANFVTILLASTEIKCGMPAYPVRESIAACGGTIIQLNLGNSTNLALTSAHCMVDQ